METNGTKNLNSKPIAKLLDQLNHDHKFFEKFIEKRNTSGNFNETKYSENNDSFSDISSLNLNDQKNDESFNSSCFDEKSLEENIIIKKKKIKIILIILMKIKMIIVILIKKIIISILILVIIVIMTVI